MIEIKNLTFGYSPKISLFENLSLQMESGHIYGLLGKNGAGKSSLLKNIVGLVNPLKGACYINGMKSIGRSASVLEDLFFIPEEIFVPPVSSSQYLKNTSGFYPKFSKEEFYKYLSIFDIDREKKMNKLSMGEQKKVIISFGLSTNTNTLIMDEPTNGLDIPSKAQFRKVIASALTEERCIVISTHQVRDLDNLIDSVVILHEREIVINHSIEEISSKICFGNFSGEPFEVLYEEQGLRGKNAIVANTSQITSKVDLELLFNAISNGNPSLIKLLNSSKNEKSIQY